jgi:hypothetical protein
VTARTCMPQADNLLTTSLPTVPVAPVIRIIAASLLGAQHACLPKHLSELFVLHSVP